MWSLLYPIDVACAAGHDIVDVAAEAYQAIIQTIVGVILLLAGAKRWISPAPATIPLAGRRHPVWDYEV
jgi:hypothetical protein